MPYCFVPRCKGGSPAQRKYYEEHKLAPLHFFRPKTEEQRKKWEVMIKRDQTPLTMKSQVCSNHFLEEDMELFYKHVIKGEVVLIPRGRAASLKPDALPKKLDNYPKYYQPKLTTRKPPAKRTNYIPSKKSKEAAFTNKTNPTPEARENVVEESMVLHDISNENTPPDQSCPQETDKQACPEWNHLRVTELILPNGWVVCNTTEIDTKILVHINADIQIDKSITYKDTNPPEIIFRGKIKLEGDKAEANSLWSGVNSVKIAQKILNTVDIMTVCQGTGLSDKPYSVCCKGSAKPKGKRCTACHTERDRLRKREARKEVVKKRLQQKRIKQKNTMQSLRRSKLRLLRKVLFYRKKVHEAMLECSKRKKEVVDEAIAELPPIQQQAVHACLNAARVKGPSGIRYTIEWVYECLLMRIKSRQLYQHIRDKNILPLPCNSVIRGYLKNFSGAYGFHPQTFELLKPKCEELEPQKRRGCILIDEMKLTEGIHFDRATLNVEGFVEWDRTLDDFGPEIEETFQAAVEKLPFDPNQKRKMKAREKTKEKNKNKRDKNLGDHALVITFQPFQGSWVQNLACFLTRGAANDEELTKLVLESIILTESSGFMVDAVITDGASWNRSMWKKFGVNEENPTAEHPCDETSERRLHFISDYPHLLKCMRNCFVDKKVLETPQGPIKFDHWKAVVEADSLREVGLRECPRLTKDHLAPNSWTKMRVNLAWQFWSGSAAAGMESFRFQGVDALEDCDQSVAFCKLVNNLSDVMNSRVPKNALQPASPQVQTIKDFISRLEEIQKYQTDIKQKALLKAEDARIAFAQKQGKKFIPQYKKIKESKAYVFSESTDVGLIVSLKGTLHLLDFLCQEIGYKYLMTARLNQDALERFFGLMRQSCGPNTHPEPRVFAQLFRLLSIYSLVKPLKGSNITGGEMLSTLLSLKDLQNKSILERKQELDKRLDEIVSAGEDLDQLVHVADLLEDHSYIQESLDEFALVYVAGYTARKAKKFTQGCEMCESKIKLQDSSKATDEHLLIKLKSRGYLTFPSNEMVALLKHLENVVVQTAKENELEENILFVVLDRLTDTYGLNLVGCEEHKTTLTKSVVKFYLIMRMHFLCKSWNRRTKELKKKYRGLRKAAHMT